MKKRLFKDKRIDVVTCSNWLGEESSKSALLKDFQIQAIPNPIDTDVFKAISKDFARKKLSLPQDKFLLLFGAMNTQDKRKGFDYLLKALEILKTKYGDEIRQQIELVIFGKSKGSDFSDLPYKIVEMGQISQIDKLVNLYNAANLFVLPSLEDNLPNTVMEALACASPVLAFDQGGIPDMIEHKKNGYLARYKSKDDLAEGIYWVWKTFQSKTNEDISYEALSINARQKVLQSFKEEIVAQKYLDLYKRII